MDTENKRSVWYGWQDLGSDSCWEDHGGRWGYKDPNASAAWYVIRFDNMQECCGSDADGMDTYHADLLRIDLTAVSLAEVKSALDCVGLDLDDLEPQYHEIALVEALLSYGVYAPLAEHTDPSYPRRVRAAARRDAEDLMSDAEACEMRMDRQVNALGSTARDFQSGDALAGLRRYVESGDVGVNPDPKMDLMLRIMGGIL